MNKLSSNSGITLVNMLIIIIVIAIISTVSIMGGLEIIKEAKETKKEDNLATLKAIVNEIHLKQGTAGVFTPGNKKIYGKPAEEILYGMNKYPDMSLENWYVLESEDLEKLGLTEYKDVKYIVNYIENKAELFSNFEESIPDYYFVNFNPNTGTGNMEKQKIQIGVKEILKIATLKKDGFVFEGWNTMPDGTGTHYEDEEEVMNLATEAGDIIELYAEWGTAYTIEYYPNGGEGTMENQIVLPGERIAIKSNEFTKDKSKFHYWTTRADGTNDGYSWTGWGGTWQYTNGKYGIQNNVLKLYAIWVEA